MMGVNPLSSATADSCTSERDALFDRAHALAGGASSSDAAGRFHCYQLARDTFHDLAYRARNRTATVALPADPWLA